MTNWKNIHSDFTSELQKEWEERNFNYEQAKEWINIGLEVRDAEFAAWLQKQNISCRIITNEMTSDDVSKLYQTFQSEKEETKWQEQQKEKSKNKGGDQEK